MERNLALEVVRATEAAALAAARFIGKGDERMADRAACDAMRKTLNSVAMDGGFISRIRFMRHGMCSSIPTEFRAGW